MPLATTPTRIGRTETSLLLGLGLLFGGGMLAGLGPSMDGPAATAGFLGAALLYLLSHALRAARLAVLVTPVLGISARSAILLHLVTAPVVFLVPFKLGELLRLQQLHVLGGRQHWLIPVILLLLDRLMDAAALLLLFGVLAIVTPFETVPSAVILSLGLVLVAGVAFAVLPRTLTLLQRYILVHHQAPRALRVLALVDLMREATTTGARQFGRQGGLLIVISTLIWICELMAMAVLLAFLGQPASEAGTLLVTRTATEWSVLLGWTDDPVQRAAAVLALGALLVVWPLSLRLHLRRRGLEPRRAVNRRGALDAR